MKKILILFGVLMFVVLPVCADDAITTGVDVEDEVSVEDVETSNESNAVADVVVDESAAVVAETATIEDSESGVEGQASALEDVSVKEADGSGSHQDVVAKIEVKERLSCEQMSARISELGKSVKTDNSVAEELSNLKNEYRKKCVNSSAGRRIASGGRMSSVAVSAGKRVVRADAEDEESNKTNTEKQDTPVVAEGSAETDVVEIKEEVVVADNTASGDAVDEVAQTEKELANLAAGLCADGSAPNKFGCCAGEIFKDLGNTVFACCPKSGGDCFPPIKQKVVM